MKGDFTPSQICWSDNYHPQTPYEAYRGYYADLQRQHKYLNTFRGAIRSYDGPLATGGGGGGSNRLVGDRSRDNTPSYRQSNGYYSQRQYTPAHGLSSTSQYYNPLETDSYLPSYDNEVQTRHYCFASPLYSTVWSPPPSGRKSASNTPLFGSIRRVNDGDEMYGSGRRHVYFPPSSGYDGGRDSVRSLDESSRSPQMQHVYAAGGSPATPSRTGGGGGSSSVRDASGGGGGVGSSSGASPREHVYVTRSGSGGGTVGTTTATNIIVNVASENSSSPSQNQYNSGGSSRSVEVDHDDDADDVVVVVDSGKNGF